MAEAKILNLNNILRKQMLAGIVDILFHFFPTNTNKSWLIEPS